jgi:hypothetical protein
MLVTYIIHPMAIFKCRFAWMNSGLHQSTLPLIYTDNWGRLERESVAQEVQKISPLEVSKEQHVYRSLRRFPTHEDAFATLMMWLHSRMDDTSRTT